MLTSTYSRRYSERRDRIGFISGALTEFQIIREHMVRISYGIDGLNSMVEKKDVQWVYDNLQYVSDKSLREGMAFHLQSILQLPDNQFSEMYAMIQENMKTQLGGAPRIVYSKTGSGFIDATLKSLSVLKKADREAVMSITMKLQRFNEQIDRHKEYQQKYDAEKDSDERKRLLGNMAISNITLRMLAKQISDEVSLFESKHAK